MGRKEISAGIPEEDHAKGSGEPLSLAPLIRSYNLTSSILKLLPLRLISTPKAGCI